MRHDDRSFSPNLAHAITQIGDELVERGELRLGGQVAIQVAHQTDTDGNIVKVVAGHMSPVELPRPAGANLDFAIA